MPRGGWPPDAAHSIPLRAARAQALVPVVRLVRPSADRRSEAQVLTSKSASTGSSFDFEAAPSAGPGAGSPPGCVVPDDCL